MIKKMFFFFFCFKLSVTLLLVQIGLLAGWSSPYIAFLTSPNSHIPITLNEASWIVSLLNAGRLIGAIFGALCVNYFGSKRTIFIISLPLIFGWLFIILADRVEWLYVSRFLGGIALGKTYSCFSLYLGEITDPSIRGATVVLGMRFSNVCARKRSRTNKSAVFDFSIASTVFITLR